MADSKELVKRRALGCVRFVVEVLWWWVGNKDLSLVDRT
jgi:hypothetical protein